MLAIAACVYSAAMGAYSANSAAVSAINAAYINSEFAGQWPSKFQIIALTEILAIMVIRGAYHVR